MAVFDFAPNSQVPETVPREASGVISMGGWQFSARPTSPFQRKFRVRLHGMKWILNPTTGLYDSTTTPTINARALELFYQAHETWNPFTWTHPHLGVLTVRFSVPLAVPAAKENSGGLIDPIELTFVEHNPGY